MSRDLERYVNFIKERTGKTVAVYSSDLNYLLGCAATDALEGEIKRIVSYKSKNKTYFPFKFGGKDYVGIVDGAEETDRTACSLIAAVFESGALKERQLGKKELLRNIITGDCGESDAANFMKKYSVSDYPLTVFMTVCDDGKSGEVENFLENFKTAPHDMAIAIDDFTCALLRFSSPNVQEGEIQSAADYARLLVASAEEELSLKIRVGVGNEVKDFTETAISFKQAETALRMNGVFEGKTSVATYKDYIHVKMLEELPRYKLKEYLEALTDSEAKNILSDAEMVATAEEFLQSDLNVSETSRNLYMHRNTLMYRLDKIEKETGLDIRKFQDASTFRLILILYKLLR